LQPNSCLSDSVAHKAPHERTRKDCQMMSTGRYVLLCTMTLILSVTAACGQWVEAVIPLPDSLSGLTSVGSLLFHSPTNTMYVGGDESHLVAINAQTNSKLNKVAVGRGSHLLCSNPSGNKVYCNNRYEYSITVIDGATNLPIETIPVGRRLTDICYSGQQDKLYCANAYDSIVDVIDCATDSVVSRLSLGTGTCALCYNPQLNRIYCAHWDRDEVSVIDCTSDTVVATVWVRGVEPVNLCYDSASGCVYTTNAASNTVSVIDCGGDTVVRIVPVGHSPELVLAGPPGKVYCTNFTDSSVSVISDSGVKTIRTCVLPRRLSYDPVNNKVYCAGSGDSVAVIDAASDTVVAEARIRLSVGTLCYNPAGNNTYLVCSGGVVSVLGGVSDTVEATIEVGACTPGPLCYNTTNNRLYCMDRADNRLFVVDGDSSRVLKELKTVGTSYGSDTIIWNPVSNKVYMADSYDSTVFILDCASDSIVATVVAGHGPEALCSSKDGKVYVAYHGGGVAVIDGTGDSVRTVIPVDGGCRSLCYDKTNNKVYVGEGSGDGDTVSVIDADADSVVATIPMPYIDYPIVCWNQNHNKVYVSDPYCDSLAVIDCAGDTVLRNIRVTAGPDLLYSDSVCDKIYAAGYWDDCLRIVRASTDTCYQSLSVGSVGALLDNGKQGPANRLYCAGHDTVTVIGGYKTDTIFRRIAVAEYAVALAWNPAHSRVYVSNSGSSSITVIRDTFEVGLEESQLPGLSHKVQATVVRGVLNLALGGGRPPGHAADLLDAAGRRVMDLQAGTNDVRRLAPGVYFVREQAQARGQVVRKVVLTK
jgi:YVTN family beta-propeller protein